MPSQSATAILVAGMHRSGTSALAGALGKMGIPLGEHLLDPGPDNPKGYWEHRDIVEVHERLLRALGSRWDDVRALPSGWMTSDAAKRAAEAIDALLTRDFERETLWAVKDPRVCRFLPLWLDVLERKDIRPVVLLMVREPGEVSASIEARSHWRSPLGEMLWLRYVTEAEVASRNLARSVIVYDDLLTDPVATVADALHRLGVQTPRSTEQGRKALAGFIDKTDRHHVHSPVDKPDAEVPLIAEAIFASLASIAHGEDAWASVQKGEAEFGKYWQREGAAVDALAEMAAKLAEDAESQWIENKQLSSKLTAQVQWSDEAQADRELLQAEKGRLQSELTAQINWSNDAQAKLEAKQSEMARLQSELTAQISWSNDAQARLESQQSKQAMLTAELAARTRLLGEARTQIGLLQKDGSELVTKLQQAVADSSCVRAELEEALRVHETERERVAGELQLVNDQRALLACEIGAIYHSMSWKLTRPLRAAAAYLKPKVQPFDKQDNDTP